MAFYIYVLLSLKNGRFYTGSTGDIVRRIGEHNSGRSKATRHLRPFIMVHQEEFATRSEAVNREMFLKTGCGREEIAELIRKIESATCRRGDRSPS